MGPVRSRSARVCGIDLHAGGIARERPSTPRIRPLFEGIAGEPYSSGGCGLAVEEHDHAGVRPGATRPPCCWRDVQAVGGV